MSVETGKRTLRPRNAKRKSLDDDDAELGADLLIFEFESGVLTNCPNGTTLKNYLTSKIELSDFAVADLIHQGVDFNMPYCHFGPVDATTSCTSPSPKRKSKAVSIVTPPVQANAARRTPSSTSSSSSSKHALVAMVPTQTFQFEYKWGPSSEDCDDSLFHLPGISSITPEPFVADPEKLLAAKMMLMDEQAKDTAAGSFL